MSHSSTSITSCAKSCARSCTQLFAGGRTTVVYATTEPLEALQLGGRTTLLAEGRMLQSGPTMRGFPAACDACRRTRFQRSAVERHSCDCRRCSQRSSRWLTACDCRSRRHWPRASTADDADHAGHPRARVLALRHGRSADGASRSRRSRGDQRFRDLHAPVARRHAAGRTDSWRPRSAARRALRSVCPTRASLYGFDRSGQFLFAPES